MANVALITGGASGIGLALTKHLLAKDRDVVIDDADNIFASIDPSKPPRKPDVSTIEIDLHGIYYGIKLFAHYAWRNPTPSGKIVVTSSVAGFYPNPASPQYAAAKHGVIGLVRSLAPVAAPHNITINAIAPAFVATNIDPNLRATFSEKYLTPMSTILRAFDELMDDELKHNGATVEGCVEGLFYREPIEPLSDTLKQARGTGTVRAWITSYIEKISKRTRLREAGL